MSSESSSVSELSQFIISLCEDPQKAQAFRKHPEVFIEASGLSQESKSLLLSGKETFLRTINPTARPKGDLVIIILVVVVVV
jgi:hypothetical protein